MKTSHMPAHMAVHADSWASRNAMPSYDFSDLTPESSGPRGSRLRTFSAGVLFIMLFFPVVLLLFVELSLGLGSHLIDQWKSHPTAVDHGR
jgi:hypothetical protein